MSKPKVILMTFPGLCGASTIDAFIQESGLEVIGIILSDRIFKGKNDVQTIFRIVELTGFTFLSYAAIATDMSWVNLKAMKLPKGVHTNIPVHKTKDINCKKTKQWIRDLEPDYLASNYFNQIIDSNTANLPKIECVNCHGALLPKLRGPDPAFRTIERGITDSGVTVHRVEDGIDEGLIYYQDNLQVQYESLLWYDFILWTQAAKTLAYWIANRDKIKSKPVSQAGAEEDYCTWPTSEEVNAFKKNGHKLYRVKDYVRAISRIAKGNYDFDELLDLKPGIR